MEEVDEKILSDKLNKEKFAKQTKFKIYFFFIITIVILLLGVYGYFFLNKENNNEIAARSSIKIEEKENVEPTPFPFRELTIPYLKNRVYKSNLGSLKKVSENLNYTSYLASYDSDGFKINGLLTIPSGTQPIEGWSAIVFVHGYIPPANYKTLENYSSYVDALARESFVVFKIDLRGNGDSEGEPGGAYYSSDYIIDTLNAYTALKNSDFVNPEKIGLWGHSMAGNVVSRALAAKPTIPAISIWAGAVYTYEDFSKFSIQDNSYRPPSQDSEARRKRNELFEIYGQFDPNSEFWKQVPMTNYLDDIKGAIQINHAVDDNIVDIRYSRNFKSLLDKTSIIHELNEFPSGGHNISGTSFSQAMDNTVEFFRKNL